jgi:hypothetical protein
VYRTSHAIFSASPILSYITYNLGSSGEKRFLAKSEMVSLKKNKNILHLNTMKNTVFNLP